jgi:protein O-GlcNAc transferase
LRRNVGHMGIVQLIAALIFTSTACSQSSSMASKRVAALYQAGVAAVSKNDLETARSDFQAAVHLDPSSGPLHGALGFVLLKMGKAQESVPELETALRSNGSDSATGSNLASAYDQLGQRDKALAVFSRMENIARTQKRTLTAALYAMYARELAAAQQVPSAIIQMHRAIALAPLDAALVDNLGSLYAAQRNWPAAEQQFRAALGLNSDLASAHLHLALALAAQQKSGAKDELAEAYRLAPNDAVVNLEYGRALAADGDDQAALPLLQRAVDLPGHPIQASYQLALALQRAGRTAEAIPLYETALAAESDNADVLTNLGMAFCQQKKPEAALPLLQKAVTLAPRNTMALEDLAAAYIQLNQFDNAIVQLRAAIQLDPDAPQLHYNLGVAYKLNDDPTDAIPQYMEAEKLDPHQSEAPFALGMLYMQAGRYDDAARELKTSLSMQPLNGEAWATLGSVYSKLEKLPEAEAALRQAVLQLPQQPDPHLTLATVLAKENKPEETVAERKVAAGLMRTNMNRQRAEVSTHSGEASFKSGDLHRAIAEFNEALSFDPAYNDAHAGLARVYDTQGKPAEAAAERARITEKTP